jgi:2',3'-cyclic-nucleotide 2'-phosphodiesterase (5'-nucleotidase family)
VKKKTLSSLLLAGWLAAGASAAAETAALTILHTNDTHGHLLPFRYPALVHSNPGLETLPTGVELGGIARRATLARRIRAEQEARGIPVWLVDAGDFTDGTVFSLEYHGLADLEAMAAAGYTLGALGNHELNQPLAALQRLLAKAAYPLLCANVTLTATGEPLTTPSLVRQAGPLRIGVFGLLTHEAADYEAARDGLRVEAELAAAQRVARELRTRADVVIAVSHAGKATDERIAVEVPEIDVIVGGHSHSRLPSGELVWRSQSLAVDDVGGTVLVQAHQWAGELGRLDLLFTREPGGRWHVSRYRAALLPISADLPEDPAVAEAVARYWQPVAARYGEVIGQAMGDFVSQGNDQADYNLVADAMREALRTEIHLENQGGVRAPLASGPITRADLVALDPFDNKLVTCHLRGRQIEQILLRYLPAVSGLRYQIEDGRLVQASVAGRRLEPNRRYSVSTNSFLARIALSGLAGIDLRDTGRSRRETLVAHIRERRTIHPSFDGRRVVVGP